MSTRSRRRSSPDEAETYDDEFSFVSDADIEAFMAEQEIEEELEEDKNEGFLNLQTGAGLGLIGLGGLYALQILGLFSLAPGLLDTLVQVMPVLASILIMLTGFGVLSWSPAARRRRVARKRAARIRQRQKTMGRGGRRSKTTEPGRGQDALKVAERLARKAGRAASDTASRTAARVEANKRKNYRLAKNRRERKLSGVAAGIAEYFGLEPTVVRIAFVLATIFGQGAGLVLYVILALALPNGQPGDDDDDNRSRSRARRGRRSGRERGDRRTFHVDDD